MFDLKIGSATAIAIIKDYPASFDSFVGCIVASFGLTSSCFGGSLDFIEIT